MTEKRRRGRPVGTEINDDAALAKVADLRLASPRMKLSVTLQAVRKDEEHKGQSQRATDERRRTKFKARQAALMEAAAKRRATKEARATSGGGAYPTGMGHGVSLASLRNPLQDASSAALSNPIADAVARATINPLQDAIAAAMRNPLEEAVDALGRYASPRHEAQRAADQLRAVQAGFGPGWLYETARRIEEQRRLLDQIDITNRWLWPHR